VQSSTETALQISPPFMEEKGANRIGAPLINLTKSNAVAYKNSSVQTILREMKIVIHDIFGAHHLRRWRFSHGIHHRHEKGSAPCVSGAS